MKKVVNVVIVMATVLSLSSCFNDRQEALLSRFADPKEEYGMLLDGIVTYQGDTVVFDFIPAVSFALGEDAKDVILVISGGDTCKFARKMINDNNFPAPGKDGRKFMNWWQTKADYYPDFDGKLAAREEKFFKIFEKVVKNGQIEYAMFPTEQALKENFIRTYDKTPEQAAKLAAKVSQPLFSRRGL